MKRAYNRISTTSVASNTNAVATIIRTTPFGPRAIKVVAKMDEAVPITIKVILYEEAK
jgi:hypothetical protein